LGKLRDSASHLDRLWQIVSSLFQHFGDILARMFRPAEEQRDFVNAQNRDDAAGERARAFVPRRTYEPDCLDPRARWVASSPRTYAA